MFILTKLTQLLLLPGTIVLGLIGVSVEEDSGVLRSFINSIFWGVISLWAVFAIWG